MGHAFLIICSFGEVEIRFMKDKEMIFKTISLPAIWILKKESKVLLVYFISPITFGV